MDLDKTKYGSRRAMKLPQIVPNVPGQKMETEEKVEIAKSVADALDKNYAQKKAEVTYKEGIEENLMLRYDSSELVVITKMKKLTAYIITVTTKSPQKFRFTFVNRMHNYCLDIIENMFRANSLKKSDAKNRLKRKEYQHEAYVLLRLLAYISFLAYENACILKKQYEQISLQISDCTNLLVAWTKSDDR